MPVINTQIIENIDITENGTYDVARYTNANVDVSPNIKPLYITPTTSAQSFTPTTVDGYGPVTVSAVTSSIDANIIPENIKKNVSILGVTGTHEGGGSDSSKVFVTPVSATDPTWEYSWIEGDDWDTATNKTLVFYGTDGKEVNIQYVDGANRSGPFTCISGSNVNGVCTIQVKDANDYVFFIKYIKESLNFVEYCPTFGSSDIQGCEPILIPLHPKVGDQIPVYDPDGYNKIDMINGTKTPTYYSSEVQLFIFESGAGQHYVDGPITVSEVNYTDGHCSVKLQDAYGNVFNNIWVSPASTKTITENGEYSVEGFSKVNINVHGGGGGGGNSGQVCGIAIDSAPGFPSSNIFYRDFNSPEENYVWVNDFSEEVYTLVENPTTNDLAYSDPMCEFDSTTIWEIHTGGIVVNGELYFKNYDYSSDWGSYVRPGGHECFVNTTGDPSVGDTVYIQPDTEAPQLGEVEQVYSQGGSSGKYSLGQFVDDDYGNFVGTVQGFHTDEDGNEYALLVIDNAPSGTYKWLDSAVSIPGLAEYNDVNIWSDKETATSKCDKIVNSGYTSYAVETCREYSFDINGITYYGQLPTLPELLKIAMNAPEVINGSRSSTSSQVSSSNIRVLMSSGLVNNSGKTASCNIVPILELPN